jgi:transcription-repair coupling factor (superfamily II helicase)
MDLPRLSPGKRYALPRPVGSADALLLARQAERDRAAGQCTAIITGDAADAQRLVEEIPVLAPPGPDLRAPGHPLADLAG